MLRRVIVFTLSQKLPQIAIEQPNLRRLALPEQCQFRLFRAALARLVGSRLPPEAVSENRRVGRERRPALMPLE
jgi:hypothetical protein